MEAPTMCASGRTLGAEGAIITGRASRDTGGPTAGGLSATGYASQPDSQLRGPMTESPRVLHAIPVAAGLPRPRLMARLNEVLDARVGIVVAPPGAGKTNLMARWARQAPVDVVWHRATPQDADPDELVRRLGDTLRPLAPGRPPARDAQELLATIAAHASPLVLVIDDLQLADRPPVIAALQNLLLDAPDHLHMLIGSRRATGLNLARTELSSVVITGEELRLRSDETARLFREVYHSPLATQDAVQITRQTEGWAAAIRLLHLSMAGLPVPQQQATIRGLGDRTRYASAYLTHQVFVGLPTGVLDFLRKTSVLPRLTPARCDRLLGTDDAHDTLRTAEPHLGLLVSRRNGAAQHRLHPVLRSHLLTELRDAWGDARVAAHTRRAAAILAEDGHPVEAARALAAADDWDGLRELLAGSGALIARARDQDWLDRLPDRVVAGEPWLQLARAQTALRRGSLTEALQLAERAAQSFAGADGEATDLCHDLAHFAASWTRGDVQPGASWGEQLRVVVRRPRMDRRGWPGVPHAEAGLLCGLELTILGDLVAARRLLGQCVPELSPDSAAAMTGRLLAVALDFCDPVAADNLAHDAEELGMPWFARMARGVAAATEYALGRTEAIGDPLAHAIADADRLDDGWGAALLTSLRCVALLRAGRPAEADFEALVARFRTLDAPALEAWAHAGLALCTSTLQLPEARRAAEIAVGFTRSAGTPGALAISYAALGLAGDAASDRDRTELLAMARAEAVAAGLDVLPWAWTAQVPAVPRPRGPRPDSPAPARPPVYTETGPVVDIRCFARFEFRIGGTQPSLARVRPRAREVLRLLSLHAGHSVHRETLIDTLWRDLDPAAGTHNLHVCVSSLRAALEPGVRREERALIVRDGDRYLLPLAPGSRSDVRTFDEAVTTADRDRAEGDLPATIAALERAVGAYTGDVLPEDGPAEWVVTVRDRYRMRAADAAVLLAELRLAQDEPDAASAAALRGIDIDPCRDSAWRLLISASQAAGDLAAAERARRSYADVLASLGVVSDSAAAVRPPPDAPGRR